MNPILMTLLIGLAATTVPLAPQRGAGKSDFSGHWVVDLPSNASAETMLPTFCARDCTLAQTAQTLTVETSGRKTSYTLNGIPVRQETASPYGTSVTTTTAAWEGTSLVITFKVEAIGDRQFAPNVTRLSLNRGRLHIENVRSAMGRGPTNSQADYVRAKP